MEQCSTSSYERGQPASLSSCRGDQGFALGPDAARLEMADFHSPRACLWTAGGQHSARSLLIFDVECKSVVLARSTAGAAGSPQLSQTVYAPLSAR